MGWIIVPASVKEGDSSNTTMEFDIAWDFKTSLPYPKANKVTLEFDIKHGTTDASDLSGTSSQVTLSKNGNGMFVGKIKLDIHGDTDVESNETFEIQLTKGYWNVPGYGNFLHFHTEVAKGTIVNDDARLPDEEFVFHSGGSSIGDSGGGFITKPGYWFQKEDAGTDFSDVVEIAAQPLDPVISGQPAFAPAALGGLSMETLTVYRYDDADLTKQQVLGQLERGQMLLETVLVTPGPFDDLG
ncbi:hypothetical protein [uncultured Roseovarius sp.]|uniref:hypothetical protein n=1 Tax=uncultured Roseovarius sp. TaxID=293344 RepID=UPI00261A7B89|nr:hypothetical protein [uncultured Roseovarius sp.]